MRNSKTKRWSAGALSLIVAAVAGQRCGVAATSPAATAAPSARPQPTSPTATVQADLSLFFPAKGSDENAAALYMRAFDLYRTDRERTKFAGQWDALLERRSMRAALDQVAAGALCKQCDFIPFLPDDLSRSTKFPYLVETQVLARLMARRIERDVEAGRREQALDTARRLMAFGRHLRMSAMVLGQDIQGLACERLAMTWFDKAYGPNADAATSERIRLVRQTLDENQNWIADQIAAHRGAGGAFAADLAWLQSPHPVLRCEAVLNIAQEALPPSVLVKPTPAIDVMALLKKVQESTSPTTLRLQREDVEIKVKWPRKGLRSDVSADEVNRVRQAVEPLAKSDPDPRPRMLAKRLLDALVEPPPTPQPSSADALSSPALGLPPPPRPPKTPLR